MVNITRDWANMHELRSTQYSIVQSSSRLPKPFADRKFPAPSFQSSSLFYECTSRFRPSQLLFVLSLINFQPDDAVGSMHQLAPAAKPSIGQLLNNIHNQGL